MAQVGLLLSGAALFLNSLVLMGKANGKSVGVFNLFVGFLQIIIPFYLIVTSDQSTWTIYGYASTFLFGLTYLYVGFTACMGLEGNGLGWFSLWVSIIAVVYAVIAAFHFQDTVSTLTWVMWAYLWLLFFLSNALKKKIDGYIGKVAFIQSWVTLTVPSMLSLTGVSGTPMANELLTFTSLVAMAYFLLAIIPIKKGATSIVQTSDRQRGWN